MGFGDDLRRDDVERMRRAATVRGRQLVRRRRRTVVAMTAVAAAVVTTGVVTLVAVGPRSSAPGTSTSHRTSHGSTPAPTPPPTVDAAAWAGHGNLAFVSGGELYVLDGATARLRQVTTGSPAPADPAFSVDGRWLAFARPSGTDGAAVLWLARGDGTGAHPVGGLPTVLAGADSAATAFSWSPTADELVVTTGPVDAVPDVPRQVWLVPAGRAPRRLLGPGYSGGAVWSPDGRQVAVLWGAALADRVLETVPLAGGAPAVWLPADPSTTYYLAGWSAGYGLLVFVDQGNGGPSVENYGLPLAALARPGAALSVLTKAPVFRPPALAVGAGGRVAVVSTVDDSAGGGEGAKFAWFGKTVETCTAPSLTCTAVDDTPGTVTLDPALSAVDGSLAYVAGQQLTLGLPPHYAPTATWAEIAPWYDSRRLSIVGAGGGAPVTVAGSDGAADPVWSSHGSALVYVAHGGLWLLTDPSASPVEVASPLSPQGATDGRYLFGYADWSDQFAWSG